MPPILLILLASVLVLGMQSASAQESKRNVILFVPDGLRALAVTRDTAPALSRLSSEGVDFRNPHALFPTFTMPNSSAMATGHHLGDTGAYSNTIFTAVPVRSAGGSTAPFIENDAVLGDIDEQFGGNYLNEETLLKAARGKGYGTAAIGKLGPTFQFDHTERSGEATIVFDDATGTPGGIPVPAEIKSLLEKSGLGAKTPSRGDNGKAGDFRTPGTTIANREQQKWFADVACEIVLPLLKRRERPFVLVFWSRDPDGTQHNQGDSLGALVPGINGPTSLKAVRNADDNLAQLRQTLDDLGLSATTDIIVAADHGFSTISKESRTSSAAKVAYKDVPPGLLPPGFLAIDLAQGLGLALHDPDGKSAKVEANAYPRAGNGLIGADPADPDIVVAANGSSDLIYLPKKDRALARKVVDLLSAQDYVGGLFVDEDLGDFPGALPLSAVGLAGTARTPRPAIFVSFRSYTTGCDEPLLCAVTVADTRLQQGQGMHGSFSRADTMNFMAAVGPSFKQRFRSQAPVSNADVGQTIAHLLGLDVAAKGSLTGRVMTEALVGGAEVAVETGIRRSAADQTGRRTMLKFQTVGSTAYFDAAGSPERTVGLTD